MDGCARMGGPVDFVPGYAGADHSISIQYIEKKIVQADSVRKAGKTCGKTPKTKKNATFFAFVLEKQGGDVLY